MTEMIVLREAIDKLVWLSTNYRSLDDEDWQEVWDFTNECLRKIDGLPGAMKPPEDWSPCQQEGEEHNWLLVYNDDKRFWACDRCGIILRNLQRYQRIT